MIGSGQYVYVELWNGGKLEHGGLLQPGHDFYGKFRGDPLTVDSIVLVRLTKADVEALTDETRFGPVTVAPFVSPSSAPPGGKE